MQLGWVDFSKEDREKVLDVMNLLQEQGAVDEIGIGLIRDAFANMFFPGTSTVQTVAKYFLIVPYILKEATEGLYVDLFFYFYGLLILHLMLDGYSPVRL